MDLKYVLNSIEEGNHFIFFGNPQKTASFLKELEQSASQSEQFLTHYLIHSEIKTRLDFSRPILRKKYGDDFENIVGNLLDSYEEKKDEYLLKILEEMCGQDKEGKTANERKMPLILIEGIEKVLFKLDFTDCTKNDYNEIAKHGSAISNCFGDTLRAKIHHANRGMICGTVIDENSDEYKLTLGNYYYGFYIGNFANFELN